MVQTINTPEQTNRYIPKPESYSFEGEIWVQEFPNKVEIWIAYHDEGRRVVIVGCETGLANTDIYEQVKDLVEKEFKDREVVWETEIY